MDRSQKIAALVRLGQYLASDDPGLQAVKRRAGQANGWFTPAFTDLAIQNICRYFLQADLLEAWLAPYPETATPGTVGIVAAGNIPLVSFHDWLCGFMSGHRVRIKLSSKDNILLPHILDKMVEWYPALHGQTEVAEMLKDCDAYIATGSNNSSRYFHYYFGKYPNIIRRNRTSVAVLTGRETEAELALLAADILQYFGLGCRNVTKIFVPHGYDFEPLIQSLRGFGGLDDTHKYKNNYDYNLALLLLNNTPYMSSGALLLQEQESVFSPVSVLHYGFYDDATVLQAELAVHPDLQCIVGHGYTPFGAAQRPQLNDYADGVDTMAFLTGL
ncbi:MAG TPA: acyl-CoA reductase [Chitinophaga sp.]